MRGQPTRACAEVKSEKPRLAATDPMIIEFVLASWLIRGEKPAVAHRL